MSCLQIETRARLKPGPLSWMKRIFTRGHKGRKKWLTESACYGSRKPCTSCQWPLYSRIPHNYCLCHLKNIIIVTILEAGDCTVKTTKGEWCHFPFYHKGVKYEECTTKDHNRPWCATVERLKNKDRRWGNCARGNSVFITKLSLMLLLR